MNRIITLVLALSFLSLVGEKKEDGVIEIDVSDKIAFPKHYIVSKTKSPILIDGLSNDDAWDNAVFSDFFTDIEGLESGKVPKYDTRVKMLWDDSTLYVYAELEEEHIWGDIKKRDEIIYYNNDFEVFISPSGKTENYGEIEMNALNTVWDLFLNKPYRDGGKANFHWNLDDLKTAVNIQGTLNNPTDIDTMWTVEMAIPLAAYIELKDKPKTSPKEGEQWRINFSRVHWDHDINDGVYSRKKEDGKYLREYNWVWSSQKVINMHEPEKWAYLQFTEKESSENVDFIRDELAVYKQVIWALFRETKRGDLTYLLKEEPGTPLLFNVKYSVTGKVNVSFHKTNYGFEYTLFVPEKETRLMINESGNLKLIK